MISLKLTFFLLVLLLTHSLFLFSQDTDFNNSLLLNSNRSSDLKWPHTSPRYGLLLKNNQTFLNGFKDSVSTKTFETSSLQNQIVRPQWIRGAILPAALIVGGMITLLPDNHCLLSKYRIQEGELEMFPGINTPVDNYLQFVPLAAVFGLKAAGVKSRSDLPNQIAIMVKAEFLMGVIVHGMKKTIRIERPTGGGMNTMPSGHTAQAFVAATILDMEYRDASPWISVGGYAVATTTAIGRMVNNKHWISDVLIGAGIGIFSAKVVYYTHKYRWGKKNNIVILPAIYKNGGGVSFSMIL